MPRANSHSMAVSGGCCDWSWHLRSLWGGSVAPEGCSQYKLWWCKVGFIMIKPCIWPQNKAPVLWESRPLPGPQCGPQPVAMKRSRHLHPCFFFPTADSFPVLPSAPRAVRPPPLSPNPLPPALPRLILLSILSDNKDTGGIYLYLQPANETIQWKAAPACWSLLRPLIASSVFQFPAFTLRINFPRWIGTILPRNAFVPLAISFQSLVLLFIIIVKL